MDRRGKDAIAVDLPGKGGGFAPGGPKEGFDLIPMWVADMNFATAPSIIEAIQKRISHPAFGYFGPSDAYFDAIINWQKVRNGVEGLTKEEIGYENGVLGGLVSALNAFASHGDGVLVHSPTYIGFTKSIEGAGYRIVHSRMKRDEQGVWRMDYEDMDAKLKENKIHVAVFCNPHNPTGRVWEPEEIQKAMEVYKENDCIVIADEIWSDLILEGYHHTPVQSVSEDAKNRTIALYAPSKTFNLAGMVGSYHIIYNKYIRERVEKESSLCHYNSINLLSMYALMGAYCEEGAEWTDELREVLGENVTYACDFIEAHFPGVKVSRPQGTYMLFLDCTEWCKEHGTTIDEVQAKGYEVGVVWQDGRAFHGPCAIRMNLALPFSRVKEAFDRFAEHVFC